MPPAAVPDRLPCSTATEWNQHVKDAMAIIDQQEDENNWDRLERAFFVLASVVRGGAYKLEADFVPGLKIIARATSNAILSDRSRLSGSAVELLTVIGARMGFKFEPLISLFIPAVIKITSRPSKVYLSRAQNCLKLFAAYCRSPLLVILLKDALTEKSVSARLVAIDALHDLLSTAVVDGLPKKTMKMVEDVEWIIKTSARDPNPEIRKMARRSFASYTRLWSERLAEFTRPLTPTTRRYLEINDAGSSKSEAARRPPITSVSTTPSNIKSQNPPQQANYPPAQSSPTLSRMKSKSQAQLRPTSSHIRQEPPARPASSQSNIRAMTRHVPDMTGQPCEDQPHARRLRTAKSTYFNRGIVGAVSTATMTSRSTVSDQNSRPPSRHGPPEAKMDTDSEHQPQVATIERLVYSVPLKVPAAPTSTMRQPTERQKHGFSTITVPHRERLLPGLVDVPATLPHAKPAPISSPAVPLSSVQARIKAIETHNLSSTDTSNQRGERYLYPFVASKAFVPVSRRRERQDLDVREIAVAATIPLPPSPIPLSADDGVETAEHRPQSRGDSNERPVSTASHASSTTIAVTSAAVASSSRQDSRQDRNRERVKPGLLSSKSTSMFRPASRRNPATNNNVVTYSAPQSRKVSAFGAPVIVTTIQTIQPAPPVPPIQTTRPALPPVTSAPSRTQGKTAATADSEARATVKAPSATQTTPPLSSFTASSSSSRSLSGATGNTTASHPSAASVLSISGRVFSRGAPSSTTSKFLAEVQSVPVAPREPRIRNATGATASQLAKQKPPVQKKTVLRSKPSSLRSAKSTADVRAMCGNAGIVSSAKPVSGLEAVAKIPLPLSPKLEPTTAAEEVPLPPSPVLSRTNLEPVLAFPTIENIKLRLSVVLPDETKGFGGPVSPSVSASRKLDDLAESDDVEAERTMTREAVGVDMKDDRRSESDDDEGEFTLEELEKPPARFIASKDICTTNSTPAEDDAPIPVPIPASRASSPAKLANGEKGTRERAGSRVALGEMGTNIIESI